MQMIDYVSMIFSNQEYQTHNSPWFIVKGVLRTWVTSTGTGVSGTG